MSVTTNYINFLISQYNDKPNARAEIEALITPLAENVDFLNNLPEAFDIDFAIGKQLDIIGKIVGLSRVVPFGTPKIFFGFSATPNTAGFKTEFVDGAPFYLVNTPAYTDTQLTDDDYRFLLKAKIAKNITTNTTFSDGVSISAAINYIFNGKAYIVDNLDMSFTLVIADLTANLTLLDYAIKLDILPKPAAVRLEYIIQTSTKAFGFRDTPNTAGFKTEFVDGAPFAQILIL